MMAKFTLIYASKCLDDEGIVEIETLEELLELQRMVGHDLIVTAPKGDRPGSLWVYDDYME